MNKRINFEDNIFILLMRIRMIRDIITLDADPELFIEKTLDDIYFIDHILRNLLGYLQGNSRLIEREELLEHLSETEWQFSQVLSDLLDHEGDFSVRDIPTISDKLTALRRNSQERRKIADNLSPVENVVPGSPVVSTDELTELLKAF